MKTSNQCLIAAIMLAGGIAAQSDPYINFDCNNIPNVCENMCYGAYCSDYGNGLIGAGLTYDAPNQAMKDTRYNDTCGNVVCTANESCDEYPFKTTSDADIEDSYARCVPTVPFNENSSQGGTLSNFYQTITAPQPFIITFGNPGATANCNYPPDCSNADGKEWRNGQTAGTPTNPPTRRFKRGLTRHYYRMESGMEVLSFTELRIGATLFSTTLNETDAADINKVEKKDPLVEYVRKDEVVAEHLYSK